MDMPGLVVDGDKFAPNYAWISDKEKLVTVSVLIDHTAADAGLPAGYPTGLLRSGLLLGKVTATGEFKEYTPAAADGTETAAGILLHAVPMRDPFGNAFAAAQEVFGEMVKAGPVRSDALILYDAAARVDLETNGKILFVDLAN